MRKILILCALVAGCDDGSSTLEDAGGNTPTDAELDAAVDVADEDAGSADPDTSSDIADAGLDSGPDAGPDAGLACGTERQQVDIRIPMRDGESLTAFVDRPLDDACVLPTVVVQTPYGAENARTTYIGERATRPLFASPHYSFVFVDWRGRFGSSDVPGANQSGRLAMDSFDTVEWIAEQPWSDGHIGTWGVSALCGAQFRTAAQAPPSLKAMVPIMCAIRTRYDQVWPGGVLRHEWAYGLDALGFGLRTLYESHPRRDGLWRIAEGANPANAMAAPALVVAGWFDLQPNLTIDAWRELTLASDPSVRDAHRLLVGPWIHFATGGEMSAGAGRMLTEEELRWMDPDRAIDQASLAFFDHHLRGIPQDIPVVRYFQVNEGWRDAATWPPDATPTALELTADGALTEAAEAAEVDIPYDPADPSPTLGGATLSPYNLLVDRPRENPLAHGPTSQAPLLERDDQRTFMTDPLDAPLQLLGPVSLAATVATTGGDADIAIRILDIDATGDPLLIAEGIQRLSARGDPAVAAPVKPGEPYEITVSTGADLAYTIPAGHRLGVMVSGSNWPLFARNPSTGAPLHEDDATRATPAELKSPGEPATHTLFLGEGQTRLQFSVAP